MTKNLPTLAYQPYRALIKYHVRAALALVKVSEQGRLQLHFAYWTTVAILPQGSQLFSTYKWLSTSLRWAIGVSLLEHRRNEEILEEAMVEAIAAVMGRRRLEWFGHVKRRGEPENIRTVAEMKMEGKRPIEEDRSCGGTILSEGS